MNTEHAGNSGEGMVGVVREGVGHLTCFYKI